MSFDIFPLGNGRKPLLRSWEAKANHLKISESTPLSLLTMVKTSTAHHHPRSDHRHSHRGSHRLRRPNMNAAAPLDKDCDTAPIEEKLSLDQSEWPKICISLSRKEKEDDFLAMRGSKLPQRPKKRAKYIDKSLQYCFPGMWLSDLTRGRYEVREKRCNKKRRMGLKGMESIESDSE